MLKVYTDGGFKTSRQPQDNKLVSFVSAFWCKDKELIEHITIDKTPTLQHYGNLAEFIAIELAVKYAIEQDENKIVIYTDSKTCLAWINAVNRGVYTKKGKTKVLQFATVKHQEVFDSLVELTEYIDIDIKWIPREQNIIGIILEERDI